MINHSLMMVEVFKTNVCDKKTARDIVAALAILYPEYLVNFDLQDCDRILRVESTKDTNVEPLPIIDMLASKGFLCELLE